jgi:hypothetical protein
MALGDRSRRTNQRDRPLRGLFRLSDGSQSSGQSGAEAHVERIFRLTREADLPIPPVHVRPLNCENRAPVAQSGHAGRRSGIGSSIDLNINAGSVRLCQNAVQASILPCRNTD